MTKKPPPTSNSNKKPRDLHGVQDGEQVFSENLRSQLHKN